MILRAGPHLAEGMNNLPIMRAMMALGATVADALPGVSCATWSLSGVRVAPAEFIASIDRWLGGGPLPVPALIRFKNAIDEGVESVGLAFFHGQEVRIEPDLLTDRDAMIRLAMRIADQLLHRGRLDQSDVMTAPDGRTLRLEPSRNGKFVRVWPR